MASRITDTKLLFDTYDCKPGRAGFEAFKRELLGSAGTTDHQGWLLADCLLRIDEGATDAAGFPIGGAVPAIPAAANAANNAARAKRRKRLKESHMLVVRHITHKDYKRILSDPIGGLFGNGPNGALDFIEARCNTAHEESDTQDLEVEWVQISVAKDVGYTENTIYDLDTLLSAHNARLPLQAGGGHTTMMTQYAARSYAAWLSPHNICFRRP